MNDIQVKIDEMHSGIVEAIMQGISSDTPIVILNAIISGTKLGLKNNVFVEGIKKAKANKEILMGIPLKEFAIASLEILGIEKYLGDSKRIKDLIKCEFNFLE